MSKKEEVKKEVKKDVKKVEKEVKKDVKKVEKEVKKDVKKLEECPIGYIRTDIDINKPNFDLETYWGRVQQCFVHYFPLNVFATDTQLDKARVLLEKYACKEKLCITETQLWASRFLYDSAHHPETGDRINLFGRPSFYVPGNMIMAAGMLAFYKNALAIAFWQIANQGFNGNYAYCNKSKDNKFKDEDWTAIFGTGSLVAVLVAVGSGFLTRCMDGFFRRLGPFAAVSAAHAVTTPWIRSDELDKGIAIYDEKGGKIGESKNAAWEAVLMETGSKMALAAPTLLGVPLLMNIYERRGTFCRYPWAAMPLAMMLAGFMLTFVNPLICGAVCYEKGFMPIWRLEEETRKKLKDKCLTVQYYKFMN